MIIFRKIGYMIFAFIILGSLAYAEMYKWIDGNGVVHFSDSLPSEPEAISDFEKQPTCTTPTKSSNEYKQMTINTSTFDRPDVYHNHSENEYLEITQGDSVDTELKTIWNDMVKCLTNEDIDCALRYISPKTRSAYKGISKSNISKLANDISSAKNLRFVKVWGCEREYCEVEYKFTTIKNGKKYANPVKFERDPARNWWVVVF